MLRRHLGGHTQNTVVGVQLHRDGKGAVPCRVVHPIGCLDILIVHRSAAAGFAHKPNHRIGLAALDDNLVAGNAHPSASAGIGEPILLVGAVLQLRGAVHRRSGAIHAGLSGSGRLCRLGGSSRLRRLGGGSGLRAADWLQGAGKEGNGTVIPHTLLRTMGGNDNGHIQLDNGKRIDVLPFPILLEGSPVGLVLLCLAAGTRIQVIIAGAIEGQLCQHLAVDHL